MSLLAFAPEILGPNRTLELQPRRPGDAIPGAADGFLASVDHDGPAGAATVRLKLKGGIVRIQTLTMLQHGHQADACYSHTRSSPTTQQSEDYRRWLGVAAHDVK
jgi:hypothetical protein